MLKVDQTIAKHFPSAMVYSGEEIRPVFAQEDEDDSGEVLEGSDKEEEEGLEEGPTGDLDEAEEE